ncbi:MAG TPA: solute carrier family 23 protein, partial [Anaerolineales bacterium]|nr:solute carrier family 23 protein [Anaerolineales bacterium]
MATKSSKPKPKATKPAAKAKKQPVVEKQVEVQKEAGVSKVFGYLPDDNPPVGAMLSLGFQQFLTMFPATVLVAILTKFDVGVTLLASGLGTIIALLVSKRKIPMYYGSSFSYI